MKNKRWLIVLATFLLSLLLYVDRVCISAAKDLVSKDLQLSEIQMGWVFSAFALGYALLQAPGGWMADQLGPRRVLSLIVTVWSVFTGLTAVAWSFSSMLTIRFLFGAGEAGAFPGMARAVYSWIPMNERGRVQAINFSGSRIGAALTLPMISWSMVAIGWKATFVVLMFLGIAWALLWFVYFRDDPTDAAWLSDTEHDFILANRQQVAAAMSSAGSKKISNWPVLSSSTVRALCGQYFASNFTFFFGLTWFFPQLTRRYGLSGLEASLFAAVPMLGGALGCWVSGWAVDRLYTTGRWVPSRRLPAMSGFALSAIGLIGTAYAATPLSSSIWFTLCIFGADMTLPPSWSTCVDIGRRRSGVISGTMNMAGNVGSFITSLAFPYLLKWTGSPMPFFYIAATLNVIAIALWMQTDPRISLEPET